MTPFAYLWSQDRSETLRSRELVRATDRELYGSDLHSQDAPEQRPSKEWTPEELHRELRLQTEATGRTARSGAERAREDATTKARWYGVLGVALALCFFGAPLGLIFAGASFVQMKRLNKAPVLAWAAFAVSGFWASCFISNWYGALTADSDPVTDLEAA